MKENCVQFLGQEDLLDKEMAIHSSILAWKIPWTEAPEFTKSWTWLSEFTFSLLSDKESSCQCKRHCFNPWVQKLTWERNGNPLLPCKPTESLARPQSLGSDKTLTYLSDSVQFSSVTQSCPTLCYTMDHSTSGLPVHHQLLQFTQTQVHWVNDAIQPSHPLSSPSPPTFSLSQNQGFFRIS